MVILGNGGAAAVATRAARVSGYLGQIHLVSDADTPAFNPMLSPYYLKGEIPWDRCFPFGPGFYRENDIICHFDTAAESLDAINQQVTLTRGLKLPYDLCLIATGASPIIPEVPGLRDSPRSIALRTAASAKSLESALRSARKAVVLGASLVGLKVAEILTKRGIRVVVLDVVDRVLPRGAHPSAAEILKAYFEEHGVDIRLGCAMEGMEGAKEGVVCHFPDNVVEEADFVAVCTGVRPNLGFVDPSQVEIDQAILVDERMQTSLPNLYAAGDVCRGVNPLTGKPEWLGTWGNACCQGRTAGQNMAGKDVTYAGSVQGNISPFFEWTYAQLGHLPPQGGRVRHVCGGDSAEGGYFVLAFEDDIMIGANLINSTHLAGKLRRAILQRRHWGRYLERVERVFTEERGLERVLDDVSGSLCFPD
jgi:3-phenylpropionate/trans-cinnamate dioxygenase ferredoxin reductase subunit